MFKKQIDYESKQTFSYFLIKKGFTNITETDEYSNWDLEADYANSTYYFEIKNRSFPSYKYGDTIIDNAKVQQITKKLPNLINNLYITNIFTDNKLSVVPFTSTYTVFTVKAPKTTYFTNTDKVVKTFYSWKNTDKNIYDFTI